MSSRTAVVTGGARGIGLAVCRALSAEGNQVVAVDTDRSELEKQAEMKTPPGNLRLIPYAADVSDPDEVKKLFSWVKEHHGGVDILVNNAGTCFCTDFVDIEPEEFRRQMAINFDSAFYCCQQAIPLMLKRPGVKKIINISSNGAYNFEVFDPPHYRASKAAMDNLTKHLTRQYARDGIAVNSIAPAMTRTSLFRVVTPDVLETAIAGMPRGKPMEAEEIAAWVAFLASPAGDCASGNVIILNQGRDVR